MASDRGLAFMDKNLSSKLTLGYEKTIKSEKYTWDPKKEFRINYYQTEGYYCRLTGTAVCADAGHKLRGQESKLDFSFREYGKFIKGAHPTDNKTWQEIRPEYEEVSEFLTKKGKGFLFNLQMLSIGKWNDPVHVKDQNLKELLVTYGPLVVNVYTGENYRTFKPKEFSEALPLLTAGHTMDWNENHAVVLVGWRKGFLTVYDNKNRKVREWVECWEILDSRKNWGIKSRMLIPIKDNRQIGRKECYALVPK